MISLTSWRGSFTSFHSLLMIIVARSFAVYGEPFGRAGRAGVAGVRKSGPRAAHFLSQRLQIRTVADLLGLFQNIVEHKRKLDGMR